MTDKNLKIKNNGYAILFSILIASIVLSVTISIYNVTFRQFKISGIGVESQVAFFAADTGAECAIYWDVKHTGWPRSIFATSTDSVPNGLITDNDLFCVGTDITNQIYSGGSWSGIISSDATSAVTEFTLNFSNGTSALVRVTKNPGATTIESFGRSPSTAAYQVERALEVNY